MAGEESSRRDPAVGVAAVLPPLRQNRLRFVAPSTRLAAISCCSTPRATVCESRGRQPPRRATRVFRDRSGYGVGLVLVIGWWSTLMSNFTLEPSTLVTVTFTP